MKKIITLLFALMLFGNELSAGDFDLLMEMVNDRLAVRQKPGTEKLLREYLDSVECDADTIYAIIYNPMNCPRCESVLVDFPKMLKSNSADNKLLLISSYKDADVARMYNKSKGYVADSYLYDTCNGYDDIFSFSHGNLHVVYILKLVRSEGRMLVGVEASWLDDEFIDELVAYDDAIPTKSYSVNSGKVCRQPDGSLPLMEGYRDYVLDDTLYLPISETQYHVAVNDSIFAFTDKVWNGVRLYRINGGKMDFTAFLRSDSVENRRFVTVPEWYYRRKLDSGTVYFMANGVNLLNDRRIGISYSLPKLRVESEDSTGMSVSYGNKGAIIVRDIDGSSKYDLIPLNFDTRRFFYEHFTYTPVDSGRKLLFGCRKQVWPMCDFDTTAVVNDSVNPFCSGFYDYPNPYIAIYDMEKECITGYLGNLDEHCRRSLTGYCFVTPVAASNGAEVAYCDGFSGKIYVTGLESGDPSVYELFSIDMGELPDPDPRLFGSYECVEPYDRYLYRNINRLVLTDDVIYGIVRYGHHNDEDLEHDGLTYFRIDRSDGSVKEWRFPESEDCTVLSVGMREKDGVPVLFLRRDTGEYIVRMFLHDR